MKEWKKSSCVLCAQNCGLELLVENGRMVKVRPDKDNPRSKGYVCRKGMNVLYYQYPKGRLTTPLKKMGDRFEPVPWEQAVEEIGHRLLEIREKHGPRSLAYMGASMQGGHFEAGFGVNLMRALGSQYLYSSAGQEFSGAWWVNGRVLGGQHILTVPDEAETEMLVAWGWNGMQSHQMPRAPQVLQGLSKNPDKLLVVVDPRKSETALLADMHIAVAPGADALLLKTMIVIILRNKWENKQYIEQYVEDFASISGWFMDLDVDAALDVCGLEQAQVTELCRLMTTKRWCMHPDLGVYMNRQSALVYYLLTILGAICGMFGVRGGNVIPGMIRPLGGHADERNAKVWRTVATGMFPAAAGFYPPAVVPEEILSDHPERLRAILVTGCNPLRSYPDTSAYEEAFAALDLLVVTDIVMNETAQFAHYVLPSRSMYECWDGTFFPWTYPEVYFQMRPPAVDPPGECLEPSQIFSRLAEAMQLIPDIPEEIVKAAGGKLSEFAVKMMKWVSQEPSIRPVMPFILAKTIGKHWDSGNKAALWGVLMTLPRDVMSNGDRAGFPVGHRQGEQMFRAVLESPQGVWLGRANTEEPLAGIRTKSKKLEIFIVEMKDEIVALTPEQERETLTPDTEFPLILHAGRHMQYNANTLIRNPEWNAGKRACTVAMNPVDAEELRFSDGQRVRVITEAGSESGELEISESVRRGTVIIPHGFGLEYDGSVYGVNVNRLTKKTHRDRFGTPLHRFVPCRIEE
ncbi:molybdopterin-containing oxidoreductase family protein [Desulforhopalus singaporensis]|uniref:Anaerobic selenocysteine-containing dehydrogenase n=1 Tax=Desulforhopalus singaporensis TaxID=91360 RepID=A0A1H0SPJ3_9BACT|nr:molybdopterin-dependent oxidoreductase [Desulforhopalus singaporensis]SDP43664.1 Anaerobic selenocysteine-containing dehydrogenase [Desulforhopalus singaporensis]